VARGAEGVESGEAKVREDEIESLMKRRHVGSLGVHALPRGLESAPAQFFQHRSGVGIAIREDQDVEWAGHRHLSSVRAYEDTGADPRIESGFP
jgi:hypothetical protein